MERLRLSSSSLTLTNGDFELNLFGSDIEVSKSSILFRVASNSVSLLFSSTVKPIVPLNVALYASANVKDLSVVSTLEFKTFTSLPFIKTSSLPNFCPLSFSFNISSVISKSCFSLRYVHQTANKKPLTMN